VIKAGISLGFLNILWREGLDSSLLVNLQEVAVLGALPDDDESFRV
jgi:hypothetical protein